MSKEVDYLCTIVAINIHHKNSHWCFGEGTVRMELTDEAGGAYFLLSSVGSDEPGVSLEAEELALLAEQAKRMLAQPAVAKADKDTVCVATEKDRK